MGSFITHQSVATWYVTPLVGRILSKPHLGFGEGYQSQGASEGAMVMAYEHTGVVDPRGQDTRMGFRP